ncbi:dTMP kinase [Anaeromyxobacter diazotrophicus]|uniref:Thymidylate kinase n=1 Tax=Anaeromyxobacter diazotrophicus TaxID=2590199 RepID=A0A7I9VQ20_9BACT|nr:dTMP kinase [Anaeromyxobacter diazotrophicus]GEJ58451.1 thymidylate kinase [Anaeromyxobacter diazotrophicus]
MSPRRAAGRRRRGRFLVLEGLDGAGTTTQAQRLAAWLRAQGRQVHVTAEPSGGPVGALVRQVLTGRVGGAAARPGAANPFDPHALALLFAADRLDHVASEIAPRLAEGQDVISDRYTLSSLAYQSLTCGGPAWIEAINARAPAPDATLFLEVSAATAVRRRFAASSRRELFEVPAFQRRVARSYQRALARLQEQGERVLVVDGEQPVEAVTAALAERVKSLL